MRYDIVFCPHCKKVIDLKMNNPEFLEVGTPSSFSCPKCGNQISKKQKEWINFDFVDKLIYFTRYAFIIFIMGPLFSSMVGFGIGILIFESQSTGGILSIIFSSVLICTGIYNVYIDISGSKKRSS